MFIPTLLILALISLTTHHICAPVPAIRMDLETGLVGALGAISARDSNRNPTRRVGEVTARACTVHTEFAIRHFYEYVRGCFRLI